MTSPAPPRHRQKCSLCGKPSVAQFSPFCSQGCRDRDLLNWLGDAYRVSAGPAEDDEAESDRRGLDSEA